MKLRKLLQSIFVLMAMIGSVEFTRACHAIALVNFTQQQMVAGGINVTAASDSPTCGCAPYWLDIEVRCLNEPFDAAPFNPGFHGPLATYPYFQSAQMNKPNCVVQNYPWVNIPFAGLCAGMTYQYRMRENHHGQVGPWCPVQTFTVPGATQPITAGVNATNTNLCVGQCTQINGFVAQGCGLAASYLWSTGATTATINVCPAVTTTYTVTINEQCSGFQATASITINVLPPPVAGNATITNQAGQTSGTSVAVCSGETVNLNLAGHAGNVQWQSAPNAGGPWTNIAGQTNPNFTSGPITNNTCFQAVVSGCGPSVIANTVCVTVNPMPTATVNSTTICAGQNTTLTANVNPAGGTFSWAPGGQTTNSITVSPAATTTYNMTYTLNGCPVTASGTVTLNPSPTIVVNNATICAGQGSATLTANPSVAGGTFVWTPGGQTTNSITVSPAATTTYTVDYNLNGCMASGSGTVSVIALPTVSVADVTICNGQNATLTAVPSDPGGTFSWAPGGQNTNSITVSPGVTTNYTVTYDLNGCVATDNADVIVNPNPVASFNFTASCPNDPSQFTDVSTVAAGTITSWNWSFGGGTPNTSTAQNPTSNYPSGGIYNVTLTVETATGCSHTVTQAVNVPYTPVANFTNDTICLGNQNQFTNLSTITNGTISGYTWIWGDGSPISNAQSPIKNWTNCGNYNVTLIVTSNDNCPSVPVTMDVPVHCVPVASFTVNDVCQAFSAAFNNTSTGATNYQWNFGNGNTSTQQSPSHQYAAPGTYNVTLTVSTAAGCSDNTAGTVTIHPMPSAAFTAANVCEGNNVNFTSQSNVATGTITNYNWNFGQGTSNQQNPSHLYNGANTYNVTLQVTTDNGCMADVTQPVTVHPVPVVDFSPNDVCLGTSTVFSDLSQVASGNIANWNWNFGNGNTSAQQSPSHTYGAIGTYQVTLTVNTNNGCTGTSTQSVVVHPNPVVSFTADVLDGCDPVCPQFTNTSTIASGANASFNWVFGNGQTSNEENPSLCFTNSTLQAVYYNVQLTITSDFGCVSTTTYNDYITVYPDPVADFIFNPSPASITQPEVTFTNTSYASNQWQWSFGDGGVSNIPNPMHMYADSGHYQVTLIAVNQFGCSDTITKVVVVLPDFMVFIPNAFTPNADGKNDVFRVDGYGITEIEMFLFNRWGDLIFNSNNLDIGWDGTHGSIPAKPDVYVYRVVVKDIYKKKHEYTGHVTLLR
jgi:gliding motility-associated-like protein